MGTHIVNSAVGLEQNTEIGGTIQEGTDEGGT